MENSLEIIVRDSGLEKTKAEIVLAEFSGYFAIAADWERKAKAIIVTSAEHTAEMKMAREGRLFLRDKRIAVEKRRKELKEQALREGKAIDGIANVLKGLIEPIEKYLDEQENFVKIQTEKKAADERRAAAEKAETERREAEEQRIINERIQAARLKKEREENEKLRREAEEREAAARREREAHQAEIRKAAEREAEAKRKAEDAARREREAEEAKKMAEQKLHIAEEWNRASEKAIAAAKIRDEEAAEKAKAEAKKHTITCPNCGHTWRNK